MPDKGPHVLATSPYATIGNRTYDVAILPWGATEAHNRHLPYGTDIVETERIAAESARLAAERGGRVITLPAIPYGVNTSQLDIPLTINMNPSTQLAVLRDIVVSLERHNIPKLLLLNGHGGNEFRAMIRELKLNHATFIATLNWWTIVDPARFFDEPGDHAGELETSLMMYLAPAMVLPLSEAGTGATKQFAITALREGWAWAPRDWTRISADTGVGNPARATAEKGKRYFEAITAKIAEFLVDLGTTDPGHLYQ